MHKIRFIHNSKAFQLVFASFALTFHPGAWAENATPSKAAPAAETAQTTSSAPLQNDAPAGTAKDYAEKAPSSLVQMGTGSAYYSPYAFVVDKSARTLTVWTQEDGGYRQVAQFPADLGKIDGDKRSQGDHRTPEGPYFLIDRLEGPSLDFSQYGMRAFPTDYPNFFDRRDGKTGNGIWLHAVPDKVALTRGSRGCVVVRNEVIQALTPYVRLEKTPILIEKQVEFLPSSELKSQAHELAQMIDKWRDAWERKDIESYIAFYSDEFKALNMDREQWKQFKKGLNDRYQTLAIRFSRPILLRYKDRLVARFLQSYTSDQHQDFGEKMLYLRKTANGFQIIGEEWREDKSPMARREFEDRTRAVTACAAPGTDCAATTKASASAN